MINNYCNGPKNKFSYDIKLPRKLDNEKIIKQITFLISTNQEQILMFKNPISEVEMIDRVNFFFSKPLSHSYFEYIKDDVGIEWSKKPKTWTSRGHTLSKELRSIVDIRKLDEGKYRLVYE